MTTSAYSIIYEKGIRRSLVEANCDVNQFDEEVKADVQPELAAESCRKCDNARPNDMRPGMRPCVDRPCDGGSGMRPDMRPGSGRPNMRPCGDRPCDMRPNRRPGYGRPNMRPDMRSGSGRPNMRPCVDRPCGMRPNGGLPDGWRPSDGMRSNSVMEDSDLHSEWNCGNRMIKDSVGRSMMVGCEGQTMSGCHMNDPMERLGEAFPPVMSYVPWQQWGDLYDPECGLKQGTIFKDLNYIFCGTRC